MVVQEAVWMHYCSNNASRKKGPVKSSFFFKEVVNVGASLPYELFEKLSIVDTPPLLTTTTDAIDPSLK